MTEPRTATEGASGRPLFAPRGMTWKEDPFNRGNYNLVDIESVTDPNNYVNPRKGDPDYPDPDWNDQVLAPTVEELQRGGVPPMVEEPDEDDAGF